MIALREFAIEDCGPYSLTLARGDVVGVVGWRGASATYLLEACAGVRRHKGELLVEGRLRRPTDVAYAPEGVEQILFGRTAAEAIGPRGVAFAARLGVEHLLSRPPQELSSGERRRLALAAVFGSGRPLLLLDRPTAGLDPDGQDLFWQAACDYPGVLLLTLSWPEEAPLCTALLPAPGIGGAWPGGPLSAERQREVRWPPDAAADLRWTLGAPGRWDDPAKEVDRWRAKRKPR